MSSDAHIHVVLDYFDGCNTGELEHLLRTLDTDVVHYFLPAVHPPIRGAEHLARYWRKFKQVYDPRWKIDHVIGTGDEVVSEWSCAYTLPKNGQCRESYGPSSIGMSTLSTPLNVYAAEWILYGCDIDRMNVSLSAIWAVFGRVSLNFSPSILVSIDPSSPRYSMGAKGLGSNVSN